MGFDTTTTVVSSVPDSTYGELLTFTAIVSPAGQGLPTPTGTVQFLIDGSNFGAPVDLADGSATSQAIASLSAVNHTVSASLFG